MSDQSNDTKAQNDPCDADPRSAADDAMHTKARAEVTPNDRTRSSTTCSVADDIPPQPDRTTLEGMIWNANHVVDSALSAMSNGLPHPIFKRCAAVVLISIVEAGFIFSGNVGSGVIMVHNADGSWSAPSGVGMRGVGFGFVIGHVVKDIVMVISDGDLIKNFTEKTYDMRLDGQKVITSEEISPDGTYECLSDGYEGVRSFIYSEGNFRGVSLETVVFSSCHEENRRFYEKDDVTPHQILFEKAVNIPEESGILDLHRKLNDLKAGRRRELTEEEVERKEILRKEAEKAGQAAKAEQGDSVMYVNAQEEASKEATAMPVQVSDPTNAV